jgi:uncharacterized repeat protein (TIGR01451 family)
LTGDGGDNFLIGNSGADELIGGPGFDFLSGDEGNDAIQSRDDEEDEVSCGDGTDSVIADPHDFTDDDCEAVHLGAPIVTTGAATEITQTTVTLNGSVDPRGQTVSVYVEIGTTTAYGNRSGTAVFPATVGPLNLISKWNGLSPGTTYHYRFVAANADGTVMGGDRSFVTLGTAPPTTADLSLSLKASPELLALNALVTYTVTVTNGGGAAALGVVVSDALPSALSFVSALASQGTCNNATPVRCDLGSMASGGTAVVTISARVTSLGTISNTAIVSSATTDPVAGNNTASLTVTAQKALTPITRCIVPKVKGKTLAMAKKAITRGHCALGKVRLAYSSKVKRGRVTSQKPAPGAHLRKGSKVNLTVSRGPHRALRR